MYEEYFNDHWKFQKDGGAWQEVTLPHDAMLYNERKADAKSGPGQAYFTGGSYVYEKEFERPTDGDGAPLRTLIAFEGVYRNAKVYINGELAKENAYGYMPFYVDADPYLKDGVNLIRVECENKDLPCSRWYDGAGIYRPVHLWTAEGDPKEALLPGSVRVRTVKLTDGEEKDGRSTVDAELLVESEVPVKVKILNGYIPAAEAEGTRMSVTVKDAYLWDDETPNLYTLNAVSASGDELSFEFGIRLIEWDASYGLKINGKEKLLRGGCIHHDNGILGAATVDEAEWRRVKALKDAGFNAIRSAHNPASRALLQACDTLGMFVMDETWDMWYQHKTPNDYASYWRDNYEKDLKMLVHRDFNHPSVILYSIGNEVSEPARPEGVEAAKKMVELLHAEDPTRPVTGGFNLMIINMSAKGKGLYDKVDEGKGPSDQMQGAGGMNSTVFNMIASVVGSGMNKAANSKKADDATSPVLDAVDIAGYNYASGRYKKEGKLHPKRIVVGSETLPQDILKNWRMVKELPYLVGDFMWTSWDYLGEVGIGAWSYGKGNGGFAKAYPWLVSGAGALDIIGTENAEAALARAAWGLQDTPYIAVRPVNHAGEVLNKSVWRGTDAIPSWSFAGCDGKKAVVEVYVNEEAASIALSLNGKRIGKKKVKDCRAVFKTTYTPGILKAEAFDGAGNLLSESTLKSADPATTEVRVYPCGAVPGAPLRSYSPRDVFFYEVQIADAEGIVEANADKKLKLNVENGTLVAFGSALPATKESFTNGIYTTYYGRALAAVRPTGGDDVKITAEVI